MASVLLPKHLANFRLRPKMELLMKMCVHFPILESTESSVQGDRNIVMKGVSANFRSFLFSFRFVTMNNFNRLNHDNTTLKYMKLSKNAVTPTRTSQQAAGIDLFSGELKEIPPRGRILIKTDLAINIPIGTYEISIILLHNTPPLFFRVETKRMNGIKIPVTVKLNNRINTCPLCNLIGSFQ